MKTQFVVTLALVALAGCSLLSKVGLKNEDAVAAASLVACVEQAVAAVQDDTLTHEEKVDVASKAAAECAKPVVSRFLDK